MTLDFDTILSDVLARRTPEQKPKLIVISDIGKDYDDLYALLLLVEMHRRTAVEILGFIANLEPAHKRARLARGALDLLHCASIPVACGLPASTDTHPELPHEFQDCPFMAPADTTFVEGQVMLRQLLESTDGITIVCLSSLHDISTFSQTFPNLVTDKVARVHMQGGHSQNVIPDADAANNRFHMDAARQWHEFIVQKRIPSVTYTKIAAFHTRMKSHLLQQMAASGHLIGLHLSRVQLAQDLAFYQTACNHDPGMRFQPFMDRDWFLKNKTSWFEQSPPTSRPPLTDDELIPFLDKVVVYDAIAALGACGSDLTDALGVFSDDTTADKGLHKLVGTFNDIGVTDVMAEALAFFTTSALCSKRYADTLVAAT